MKTGIKQREPIALRAKELKNGKKSLYLDFYQQGDKNHAHRYEFLKLYLLPESNRTNKELNKVTLQSAKAIQAQRLIDYANGKANIKSNKGNVLLIDYMQHYAELKKQYGQSEQNAVCVLKVISHIQEFKGNVKLCDIDKDYCIRFINYLTTAKSFNNTKNPKTLSKSTTHHYVRILTAVLNQAVKDEIIPNNPMGKVSAEEKKPVTPQGNTRTYLTAEELQRLINAPLHNTQVKSAFLFACFCGLRLSDIYDLQPKDIRTENNVTFIQKRMIKTGADVIIPLSEQAQKYLPKAKNGYYFDLPSKSAINHSLKTWAKRAEITKDVCFHVSRHTFATLLLTQGADLYTTSKLLGHSDIQVTQIYADIVNKKRVQAIELLNKINL